MKTTAGELQVGDEIRDQYLPLRVTQIMVKSESLIYMKCEIIPKDGYSPGQYKTLRKGINTKVNILNR